VIPEVVGAQLDLVPTEQLGIRILPADRLASLLHAHAAGDSDAVAELLT
jgi:hypothetical protein